MTSPINQSVYLIANAVGTIRAPIQEPFDPTPHNINYSLFQPWQNTLTGVLWQLNSFSASNGVITANWIEFALQSNVVQSIVAIPPLNASAAVGAVVLSLTTPLIGQYGGTGVNNAGLTINLGSPTTGYVLTSDVSGNATWQPVPAAGGLTLGAFGSVPNADGLTLTGNVLNMQPADGTHPGGVSTTSQTFAGAKNFAISVSSPIFAVLSGGGGTSQIEYPSSAANYNFNLPSTAGTSGYFLTSAGGGSSPMTWTATIPVTNGGTNNTSFTAYSVICAGTTSTGTFQNVSGLGSSGQVLTSGGAGALPTWETGPTGAGGWIVLSTQSVSGVTEVDFTSVITSTYNNYVLAISSPGSALGLQTSTNNGSSYSSTGYVCSPIQTDSIPLAVGGLYYLFNVTSGAQCVVHGSFVTTPGGVATLTDYFGASPDTSVNAIRVHSGSSFSGKFTLYGISQ